MAWSEQQHFGQTKFQNEYFVVNSQVSPYRQIRQAMMEIQGRTNALQKTTIQFKRCMNDIARVTAAMETEENEFHKIDRQYELELLYLDRQIWLNKIKQCKEELNGFFAIIKEKAGTDDPVKITELLEDKELENVEEHKYWIARMGKQAAVDVYATGRIGIGNLDSIAMMREEDQYATLNIAMQYSGLLNSGIAKIQNELKPQLDKMMIDGSAPRVPTFDNVEDNLDLKLYEQLTGNEQKSIQSADQSETE